MDKEKIRNIIELFIAWNGETEVIDVANLDSAIDFIADSLQEEPVSKDLHHIVDTKAKELWDEMNTGHEYSILDSYNQFLGICMEIAESIKEEPVSGDLEESVSNGLNEELDKYIKDHFTIDKEQLDRFGVEEKDYMYSMDKEDMLKMVRHFTSNYRVPVSGDLGEAGKAWLKPQLDKSYESYGERKMMELTRFDGYAMLDAIEFGANWQKEKQSR